MSKLDSRERRNLRTVLEGPPIYLRLKPEVLIEFREAIEKGYKGTLSEYINEAVMGAYARMRRLKNEQEKNDQA